MKKQIPATTQIEMDEFVNAIREAEWAAEADARMDKELLALVKKHGRKKARQILSEQASGLKALIDMENAASISRWEARYKAGTPLPLDPIHPDNQGHSKCEALTTEETTMVTNYLKKLN
jgi:hypothetical protein